MKAFIIMVWLLCGLFIVIGGLAIAFAGEQTRFYDARGNSVGTATRDSQGTTVFRDSRGRTIGRSSK